MKLKTACGIGIDCGLKTLKEAVLNIEMLATCIFPYTKINDELIELYKEFNLEDENTSIKDKFPELYN